MLVWGSHDVKIYLDIELMFSFTKTKSHFIVWGNEK